MKTYYTETMNNFSEIFNLAKKQDVIIRDKNGLQFKIIYIKEKEKKSPLDVAGINTDITTNEIINIVNETRERLINN